MARKKGAATTPASVDSKQRSSISSGGSSEQRRSSISSVTSSGRKRKEQSLADVAASLGQRTPERSQDDDGVSTRSRQLDFGSDKVDDEQREKSDAEEEKWVEASEPEEEEEIQDELDAARVAATPVRRRRGGGRRHPVFWSVEEEEFLCKGVEKYGLGSWMKILIDGQGVFSSHRTNVDLKDKWKNLTRTAPRKRQRNLPNDTPDNEGSVESQSSQSSALREESSETSLPESVAARPRRQASAIAPLKIGTDQTFPELVDVNVNLNACKDVAGLIEHLRPSFLGNTGDTDVQVIGLKSRKLFNDNENLAKCIEKNGVEFYFVYVETPEEFV